MAECGRKALSVMEAVRSRYESLQISDDVLGESGDDSSENPFYSTSGGSSSENYTSESNGDEQRSAEMSGNQSGHPPGSVSNIQAEEESWTDALREITVPAFKDTCGPAQKMPANASTIDFFQFFVPDNVIQNMVTQTNMYAKKFQERFGSDEGWCNVTLSEMKAFLGYVTSTSIHRCDSVLSIWTNGFYSNKSIALIMTQSRFEKILKYFHIVAFRSSQTSNGLYKIQPFLDSLQQSLECSFRPSQTQVYVHLKEGAGSDNLGTLKNKPQLHSLVARQLCQNLSGKNSIIFTGPSITSLNLFEEFEKQDIYCCGLLSSRKSDCTGLPQSMLTNPDAPQRRGQYTTKMKGNMSLICWHNKGHFRFLTNAYSPSKQGVIIKRKRGEVPCPLAVEAFAAHLSYICKYDDKYSKYFISHKPNKTWQQVFWLTISIVINNAYILYKMSDAYHMKRYSRAQFGERLVRELLGLEDCSPTH
ncbi:piggyBac transposable element-derived protein 5 isoform X2 [Polyodon spathula]|uniref:piggyBac transposable element-derived protein 5 isoform X2 n=1 Tax=Polyodon spathula TaxID=7913 RepID=UPI001B7E0E77|nr:piggyBac transposable element-derived protein 5 isoform X2 [Polyodon spathula]